MNQTVSNSGEEIGFELLCLIAAEIGRDMNPPVTSRKRWLREHGQTHRM
jgi:hypothetical protein